MPWSEWITPPPGVWDAYDAASVGQTLISTEWVTHRETNPTGRPTMTFPAPVWSTPTTDVQAKWQVGGGSTETCTAMVTGPVVADISLMQRYFMGASYFIVGPNTSTFTDTQIWLQRATVAVKVNPTFPDARVINPYDWGLPTDVEYTDIEYATGEDTTLLGWDGTVTVTAESGSDTEGSTHSWTARLWVDLGQSLTCGGSTSIGSTSPPDTGEVFFDVAAGNVATLTALPAALGSSEEFTLAFQPVVPIAGLPTTAPTSGGNKLDWVSNSRIEVSLAPLVQFPAYRVMLADETPPAPAPSPAPVVSTGGSDSLECGEYHFYICDRGGKIRHFELNPMIRYRWSRQRDAISEASVFVSTESPECCGYMERMECGRHELVIERNGVRVWEGPLVRIGYHQDYVEVEAHDVWHYAYKAIMRSAYNNAYPNIGKAVIRVKTILNTEMARFEALTPPINMLPNMLIYDTTGTAKTSRSTKKFQRMVWEEIDELAARGGIDYTCIGRKILVFDVDDIIGRTKPMTEADFLDEVVVTQYGMELATFSAVTDGEGHYGSAQIAPGKNPYHGVWEILENTYDEGESAQKQKDLTQAEMIGQAKRNGAGRFPTPLVVRVPDGATLAETSGVLLSDLVPGVRIPLSATQTCRKVSQEQKLDKLVCEGQEGTEVFRVTMSPAPGIADWEDAETG